MTTPSRRTSGRAGQAPKISPVQVLAVAVVLAIFITGVVIAGVVGMALVGALAVGAGALLRLRWGALHERTRIFRLMIVLICAAVALSLLYR